MTLPDDFDIRYAVPEDLEFLTACFTNPQERAPFPFETDSETEEALKNWIGFVKYKAGLTGMLSGVPCAAGVLYLMPYRKVAHHCSFYVIVAPEHRRKGIGFSMVKNLLHLAKTRFHHESVHAELFGANPLQPILTRQGFEVFAHQEDYVHLSGRQEPRTLMEYFFV